MDYLNIKSNLATFTTKDLDTLAKHYNVHIDDKDDLLWILAISILQNRPSFTMFDTHERDDIMNNYLEIADGSEPCTDYPLEKVVAGSKGMYIYPRAVLEEKGKGRLCEEIEKSHSEGVSPIVHEDSLTAWGNQAAEKYGLTVRDIVGMSPGEEMEVLLLDRNVGDYMDGTHAGTQYDPRDRGLTYATYTHSKGLCGKLDMHEIGVVHSDFQWEINLKSIGYESFWGPIPKDMTVNDLDPEVKVGWRGPAIRLTDAQRLPKHVTHYDTWWDDYMPFRRHQLSANVMDILSQN